MYPTAINPVVAAALMPYDNFAQRRADDQQIIQQQAMLTALSQQQADSRRQAVRSLQQNLTSTLAADILQPDRKRLVDRYVNPWREKIYNTLKDEYGNNPNMISRFMQEKGEWMLGQMADEIATSPELQAANQHKINYASMLKAQQDGKVLRGDPETVLTDFFAGKRADLPWQGAYDRPKIDRMLYLKTPHPTAPYGLLDNKGNRTSLPVTLEEQMAGSGLSREDAYDYFVTKKNYDPTLVWGREDPMKLAQFDLQQQRLAEDTRQRNIDNKYQQLNYELAATRERRQAQKVAQELADGTGFRYSTAVYGPIGQPLTVEGKPYLLNNDPTYFQDIHDPKVQQVVVRLTGAKPLTRTFTPQTSPQTDGQTPQQKKAITNPITYNGNQVYEIKTYRLLDANNPAKSFGIQGGKARVFNIQSDRIIKLPIISERGTVDGYSSWVRAQTGTPDGHVYDVLAALDASEVARHELDSQVDTGGKKAKQSIPSEKQPGSQTGQYTHLNDPFNGK